KVSPFASAPTVIQEAAGSEVTSAFGYSYTYNTLDDPIKPRHGYTFQISQDFAGFGGNTKYFRTLLAGGWHHPVFYDEMVGPMSLPCPCLPISARCATWPRGFRPTTAPPSRRGLCASRTIWHSVPRLVLA